MPAPKIALELIGRFDRNLDAYRSGQYKETQGKGADGGIRKFFLEAKKPSIDIRGDPHPAYQLRRKMIVISSTT